MQDFKTSASNTFAKHGMLPQIIDRISNQWAAISIELTLWISWLLRGQFLSIVVIPNSG